MFPSQLSTAVSAVADGSSSTQAIVISAGITGSAGFISSLTVIVCEVELEFPQASVKVQVRTKLY